MRGFYILAVISWLVFAPGIISTVQGQMVKGDLKFWQQVDFLGFDEIGDCEAPAGDISSVYARMLGKHLLLRVTFDDMVERRHNVVAQDFFETGSPEIEIRLTRHTDRTEVFHQSFDLKSKEISTRNAYCLRTPGANLWEAEIALATNISREELEFSIVVKQGGKVADYFLSDGRSSDAEGNCAFVHHGNQGITYTEVFYGSPWGQSGLDGSGFDEVLQVHEATNVPGNFHMSGTLMPAAQWHNPEFNDWLHTLAGNGLIEMMTSALGQHIMPFLHNNMNDWSVDIECDMVDFQYNYVPRTAWVPERVWLAPGSYPDAGVIDWLGDNWTQHGVWGVVLDDSPHLNGYDNRKIHWMNNGMGINLRVIPINNSFVGNMHYSADGAKNQIAGMGQYNICVYGTDWEVAAEMNEHDGTFFLDNYESVLWWCHDNYPGVNVWKLVDAMQNPNFNGTGAEITPGTYGLLGGPDGYGGSNNSWYTQWAATPSHSDFHDPKWTYGYIWDDAHNNLLSAPNNNLAQLGWYILMINLHETGWHDGGSVAGWEHRYSSHIKNANVYAEAARWADGQYQAPVACYFSDIDRDGVDEVVIHNQNIFAVFESIGGKINWMFYRDGYGNAHSVVGSDMAYWSESDGDYNESSNNHVAALSDVYPYQQDAVYDINIIQSSGDTVVVELSQWGVKKCIELTEGVNFLDVMYDFYGSDGYVKSGFSPGLMDLIWSGKDHVQRLWGDYGSYCGQRNASSGASVALVLGNGGGQHNTQFEGTLVLGDEIKGFDRFKTRLFAGYTSDPAGTTVPELNTIASQNMDVFPPTLNPTAFQVDNNTIELTFSEAVEFYSAQNEDNYTLEGFSQNYTIINAIRQNDWRKVRLTIQEYWSPGDEGEIVVTGVEDLNGNVIGGNNTASLLVPSGTTPHTIFVDGTNDFDPDTELIDVGDYSLYITWDNEKLYIGFESLDLNGGGDLFVNLDTDQVYGSGPSGGSWGRVVYPTAYRAEYQVAIEGGGGSIQFNHFANGLWHYPANNNCESYEGWAQNGLTEISIPWASMGNPEGVALSVHVTEEDNQVVTAAFPPENPTGNHPTFTHVYAFFIPYVTSEMPVAGMEPANVITLPNLSPEITGYIPAALNQTMEEGETIDFSVTASDPENDELTYGWYLDGVLVSSENTYQYLAALTGEIQEVKALVNDAVPGHEGDSVIWQVEVLPASGLLADFSADATTICEGSQVQFSDLSTGEITSWLWAFEGGTPAVSTDQNPVVTYADAGTYDVSLTVSNAEDSHTLTQSDYITVNGEAAVNAGADTETCENTSILLQGMADNYSSVLWTSSGDGVFSNASALSTNYTPGPGDAVAGFTEITLTAYPLIPCPDAASDMLLLGILTAPEIIQQPESLSVVTGENAGFSITADGNSPLDYQWYGPEGLLPGETSAELILENVTAADAGAYYCTVENSCGLVTSEVVVLTVQELMQQVISIPDGWSGISSYIIPEEPMVEQMFSEIVADNGLVVLQNYSSLYWPAEAINTIDLNGGWAPQSGYQLKVVENQELNITGQAVADKTMTFAAAGWYLLPVLSECGAAPEDLFSGIIGDVMIVKEIAGLKLYWPGVFQNLYTLEPGKAYAAMFTDAVTFTWPECGTEKEGLRDFNPVMEVFNNNTPSPNSHSIVLDPEATLIFSRGDQLEISNEMGNVITRIEIQKPGDAAGLQLFGQEPSNGSGRFYAENDPISLRIIRKGKSLPLKAGHDHGFDDLRWKPNGMSLIKNLEIDETAGDDENGIWFYPNPAKDRLIFSEKNPYSTISIFTADGVKVIEEQGETHQVEISSLKPGLYFIFIENNSGSFVRKFVKH